VDSTYYFSPKSTLGPYDQFEYINKQSNVFGSYADDDFGDVTAIGGEYFVEDFFVGASYQNADYNSNDESYRLSAGYFFNPDLLAKVRFVDQKDGDNVTYFSLAYNHMLNDTDYVGITVESDDDFDSRSVAAKYFVDLQQGNYLTVEGTFVSLDEADDQWNVETNYYFSKATSVFAAYDKEDNYSFGAQHFINKNIGLKVGYGNNADDSDNDAYFANLRFQF
jgi:predicted porin